MANTRHRKFFSHMCSLISEAHYEEAGQTNLLQSQPQPPITLKDTNQESKSFPIICKSLNISKHTEYLYWGQISYLVFETIVELDDDLEIWKWFKYPTYDENLEIEILEKNHKFKIYGGPRHTETAYEKFRSKIGDRINDVEFMAFSEFEGEQILHIFWMLAPVEICAYSVVESEIDYFVSCLDEDFIFSNIPSSLSVVFWEWRKMFSNKEKQIYYPTDWTFSERIINIKMPLTNKIEVVNKWTGCICRPSIIGYSNKN